MMGWSLPFYRSAVGKKAWMAVTGLVLYGYVLTHMLGNLKIFGGRDSFNEYAEWLHTSGPPLLPQAGLLWSARAVLLAAFAIHLLAALQLTLMNRAARRVGYGHYVLTRANYAARTMRWSGILILLFVVYHLLHLTVGNVHGDFRAGDVHRNVIVGFRNLWIAGFYILAQFALGFHLYHGVWSMFQTLGWEHPRLNPWRKRLAVASALLITAGFIVVPLAVLTGILREAP